ncbi:hypothetical protein HNR46_003845 [Haloferula luteola]|uniref:Uncharacterized protein n=1 Tax=Haloferula luteola TaxID=595692 RepID=A0A840VDJ7_9BACT|nr:hypothetical protein [Haloferula luteola]MBB5353584.1 hypothetical protein [Haloferula luteola]
MRWLDRLETRLHWLAFPGLFKWITLLGAIVFASQFANPHVGEWIAFDRQAILHGEWWRLVTFIFDPGFDFTAFGALFFYFAVRIAFMIDDHMQAIWPPARVTLYLLVSWISLALGLWFLPNQMMAPGGAGRFLYLSVFFAFATYFPKVQFLLFFMIPVEVRILAWFGFGALLLGTVMSPLTFPLLFGVTLPYLIWVAPSVIHRRKTLGQASTRRKNFQRASTPKEQAFHHCSVCGRTEHDDPALDFRTQEDGTEFCTDHLPKS